MNRTEKQTMIDGLNKEFAGSPHAILVDFRGLSVPAVTEFRRKVRATGGRYRVVKNTLALRAVKDTPLGRVKAPAGQLVRRLNTPGSQLARVMKAHQEKQEGSASGAQS